MISYVFTVVAVAFIFSIQTFIPSLAPQKSVPIEGNIYGICSPIEHLRGLNKQIYPILDQLRMTPFFRTYKINMENDCPFWAQQKMCNSHKCAICECNSGEIPAFWKEQQLQSSSDMFDHSLRSASKDCPQSADEWCAEEEFDPQSIYVNLAKNKESFTAFDGGKIWNAIYEENCLLERLKDIDVSQICSEETLLYQLVSGLHTSINMHVANNYIDFDQNISSPNYPLFLKGIGTKPERLRNLFFLYAVTLRAVNKAEPFLTSYDYQTMIDTQQDLQVPEIANQLLNITLQSCEEPFQEKYLFSGIQNDFRSELLLREIQTKFYNISRILDCVSCEKCKLNGKVQMKGLGTALKLLFASSTTKLKRTEIISLVNLMHRLSESIDFYENFLQLEKKAEVDYEKFKYIVSAALVIMINVVSSLCAGKKKHQKVNREKETPNPQQQDTKQKLN